MTHKEVRVFEVKSYDRYIFVTMEGGYVAGVNFHQGIGHMDESFFDPNPILTAIFFDLNGGNKMTDNIEFINECCERHCRAMLYEF